MTKKFERSFRKYDGDLSKQSLELSGMLGIYLNGDQQINVTNRPGFVYVRLRNNTNEVIQAFNEEVSVVYGLPVIVVREGNRYVIKGRDTQRYDNWGSTSSFVPVHANQHSFNPDGGGGGDLLWVYGRQMTPLGAFPSGTTGGNGVSLHSYQYRDGDGVVQNYGATGTGDLVQYKPTDNQAIMGIVYVDTDTGNPEFILNSGTLFSALITGTEEVVPYLPTVSDPSFLLVAGIRMVSGTTSLGWDNIYDLRQWNDTNLDIGSLPTGIIAPEDYIPYQDITDNSIKKTTKEELVHNDFFNGTFEESFDALVTSDGAIVTMSLEKSGGGNLTMQFSDGLTTLDCVPAQTIALTAGSDSSPQDNYIYIPQSTKVVTKSTSSFPTSAEHIKIGYFFVPSAGHTQTEGPYINQNWNDHLQDVNNQGHLSHLAERSRRDGAYYFSGIDPNGTDQDVGSSYFDWVSGNEAYFKSTSGVIYQMHRHTVPAFYSSGTFDDLHVINWNGDAYHEISDLGNIVEDSAGVSLSNKFFNLYFFAVGNKSGEYAPVMCQLPGGSYSTQTSAENDVDGYDNLTMPRQFSLDSSTGVSICRMTLRYTGGTNTLSHVSTTDLRTSSAAAGAGDVGGTTQFADNQFTIFNVVDNTKIVDFDVSGVSGGHTRTVTIPDEDTTLLTQTEVTDLTDGGQTVLHSHVGGGGSELLDIYDDSVIILYSGTAVSFDENLAVAATGSIAYVQASVPASEAGLGILVQDEGVFLGTGAVLNVVGENVDISISGSVARLFVTGTAAGGLAGVTLIEEVRPSGTSTITFDSIPGTYNALFILYASRDTRAAVNANGLSVEFNDDTTSGNYEMTFSQLNSRGLSSDGGSATQIIGVASTAVNAPTGSFMQGRFDIFEYAATDKYKQLDFRLGGLRDTSSIYGQNRWGNEVWKSTSAITKIGITSTDNFLYGTYFTLYGVTK